MSDPEWGFSRWLRGQTSAGSRSFVSIPGEYDPADGPAIGVTLVDEQDDLGEAPLESTLLQFDCIGKSKAVAHTLFAELKGILRALPCPTTLTGGTICKGATIVPGSRYLPDESGTPRYVITAAVILSE